MQKWTPTGTVHTEMEAGISLDQHELTVNEIYGVSIINQLRKT